MEPLFCIVACLFGELLVSDVSDEKTDGPVSQTPRAARKGPVALAERLARRKTYSKTMGATGRLLRLFGLK